MLDTTYCRGRHERLLDVIGACDLDAVVVGLQRNVYYLSGFFQFWLHHSAFVLFADGRSWLATANQPAQHVAADRYDSYEASWHGTQRPEQPAVVAELVQAVLEERHCRRIGIDASAVTSQLMLRREISAVAIDPQLSQMRRAKDPDELALMRRAIRCTEAMYLRARQIIAPGVPELRVYNELHAAAVESAGEQLAAHLGNDFRCGAGGGPPRADRTANAGEIYILDLGPCYRGYFADNARAIAVDRAPTDAQLRAWESLAGVFKVVESMAKPGTRCQEIFDAADRHVRLTRKDGLVHHLGHGVGLEPHEFPHLNPKWNDVLIEGEVFTAEPGAYGPELAAGIRVENQYLVTRYGVENLTPFPLGLV